MANLKTNSPVSRHIVLAFLDFLKSVEPAPGVDREGLEVAKECLEEVFKLNSSSVDDRTEPGLLVEYFSFLDSNKQHEPDFRQAATTTPMDAPSIHSTWDAADANLSQGKDLAGEPPALGVLKDELFGQFFGALDKIHFFKPTTNEDEDHFPLDKATCLFHEAVQEMERSGCQSVNSTNLAETFKTQGNRAMQEKLYSDAIDLYACAIALCENNAVYYCNRAAAYTQIHKYTEAIRDCLKSTEINPKYSKAYSRLGLAYYAQGSYREAIDKGFMKALDLDPNSDSIKENIQVAEQKLMMEELRRTERDQNAGSTSQNNEDPNGQSTGGSRNPNAPPPFTSMPFNAGALPTDFANILMNMAANAYQTQHPQEGPIDGSNTGGPDEPEIRIGGNISMNFGEDVPEELLGTWRSVMGMFSGAPPHHNSQGDMNRGSAPNS